MSHELARPEEEAVRRSSRAMVDEMCAADTTKDAQGEEPLHGEPPVNEAVVDENVADPEERHPDTGADGKRARVAVELAAGDDERSGQGRVEHGERVILLEPTDARLVMRPVQAPEAMMPDAPVEEARPELHRRRHDARRDGRGDRVQGRPARHGAPP